MTEVNYIVSLYPSKFFGYQTKTRETGKVKVYISTIWRSIEGLDYSPDEHFMAFVDNIVYITILERLCIERAFQKIRMKQRCKPLCKMEPYAVIMTDFDRINQPEVIQ